MVNEKFVKDKLSELEKVDVNCDSARYDLQLFYGILEVIYNEAYDEGIKLYGIYKQFEDKYNEICRARTNKIMHRFDNDLVICNRLLKT